jgi:hypothetical protein
MIEMPKQRLERIAAQILAGAAAQRRYESTYDEKEVVLQAIDLAAELIKQIDERPPQA